MIEVYDLDGNHIGSAESFGAARRLQCNSLPAHLRNSYAGISANGTPLFYEDRLEELFDPNCIYVGDRKI